MQTYRYPDKRVIITAMELLAKNWFTISQQLLFAILKYQLHKSRNTITTFTFTVGAFPYSFLSLVKILQSSQFRFSKREIVIQKLYKSKQVIFTGEFFLRNMQLTCTGHSGNTYTQSKYYILERNLFKLV